MDQYPIIYSYGLINHGIINHKNKQSQTQIVFISSKYRAYINT